MDGSLRHWLLLVFVAVIVGWWVVLLLNDSDTPTGFVATPTPGLAAVDETTCNARLSNLLIRTVSKKLESGETLHTPWRELPVMERYAMYRDFMGDCVR